MNGLLVAAALAVSPTAVDLAVTTVTGNAEQVAMAGSGVANAVGVGGMPLNPASLAHRRVDQEGRVVVSGAARAATLTLRGGADLPRLDAGPWEGWTTTAGLGVLVGGVGLGVHVIGTRSRPLQDEARHIDLGELRVGGAWSGGVLSVGAAAHLIGAELTTPEGEAHGLGLGADLGMTLDVPGTGLNFGLAAQTPVIDRKVSAGLGVEEMEMPAQGIIGLAWASEATPDTLRRLPLRLQMDLVLDGPVADAASPESLLLGAPALTTARPTLSPHLAAEAAVWPEHLRLRAGGYLEPARLRGVAPRVHATGGLAVRTIKLRLAGQYVWLALQNGVDVAPGYVSLKLLGLDTWHSVAVGGRPDRAPRPPPG